MAVLKPFCMSYLRNTCIKRNLSVKMCFWWNFLHIRAQILSIRQNVWPFDLWWPTYPTDLHIIDIKWPGMSIRSFWVLVWWCRLNNSETNPVFVPYPFNFSQIYWARKNREKRKYLGKAPDTTCKTVWSLCPKMVYTEEYMYQQKFCNRKYK